MFNFKNRSLSIRNTLLLMSAILPAMLYSQVTTDEEDIPYDISDGDLHLVLVKEKTFGYGEYSIARKEPPQPGMTQNIEGKGILERKYTGMGIGLDLRFAILYSFLHKNNRRLRIADDFGLGTFLSSNQVKMRDVMINEKIVPPYGSSMPSVDVGLTFYYGLQATYRINNTFDVGVKFLPVFATENSRFTIKGPSYGLHLRVKRLYIDYRLTRFKAKRYDRMDCKGSTFICVKYFLPENFTFRDNGYVFASLQSVVYKWKDPYGNGNTFVPQGYEDYKFEDNRFRLFNIGLGLMIN